MLSRLHIRNFAIIEDIEIEFSGSLNVFTGETGAGKSILIDALRFVMGERAEGEFVRSGTESCEVEAAFEIGGSDDLLILRRIFSRDGKSRAWISNRMVNTSNLREASAPLIDIHGQYDHQLLLDERTHVELLDRIAKNESSLSDYQKIYREYLSLTRRLNEIRGQEAGRERELDLLKYQISEIERAKISDPQEEETLKREHIKLAHGEKLGRKIERILGLLEEGETTVSSLLGETIRDWNELLRLDDSLAAPKKDFDEAQLKFEEVSRALRDYQEELSAEPERLKEVEGRLEALELLKKKYGPSLTDALAFFDAAKKKYDSLSNSELLEKDAKKELEKMIPQLEARARGLSEKRKKAAASLTRTIESELKDLEMPHTKFDTKFEARDFAETGKDQIEFLIQINAGEPMLPLKKIVSAGEVSRIMLAVKRALVKVDPIPTLIFDEIDANIGGRLGKVVGEKLKEISGERQVLLITHLPQIASFADRHFKVSKAVRQGRTVAEYKMVEADERVQELSQMLSGKAESEISRKHAKEMLGRGK